MNAKGHPDARCTGPEQARPRASFSQVLAPVCNNHLSLVRGNDLETIPEADGTEDGDDGAAAC